jgi:molybdate transport system regulatory protein
MIEPTLRLRLWLETEEGMLLGLGRAMLLVKVAELGSLNKAAKAMGMSYRAAWGRLKATEERLGRSVVEGGGGRKGFVLNAYGQKLAESFKAWQDEVEAFALERAQERFPWAVHAHPDAGQALGDDGDDVADDDITSDTEAS